MKTITKEALQQELEHLNNQQLQQLADFIPQISIKTISTQTRSQSIFSSLPKIY